MVQSILILVEVDNSQTVKDFILSRFKDKMAVAKHLRVGRKITEAFSPRCSISINVVDLDDTRIKGINIERTCCYICFQPSNAESANKFSPLQILPE